MLIEAKHFLNSKRSFGLLRMTGPASNSLCGLPFATLRLCVHLLFVITIVLAPSSLRAEDEKTTGTITGIVLDTDGKPAVDVLVTAAQNAEKMRDAFQAATDKDGKFTIENVPEGEYNLTARTRDSKGRAVKSTTVVAGKTRDVGTLKLRRK
jgi:5-hydroxyisourate hydrolase-like protein (transthyretin family)